MLLHILLGKCIHGENTILSACLDRHVRDGETIIHAKICDTVANKLHGLIQSTVHADHTDDMQDHVLAAHPLRGLTSQDKLDRGRNLKPCFTGRHSGSHVRAADTGRKRTKRTISTSMRICANDHVAGHRKTFLRK